MILTITTFLWYLPLKHFYCIRKIHIRMIWEVVTLVSVKHLLMRGKIFESLQIQMCWMTKVLSENIWSVLWCFGADLIILSSAWLLISSFVCGLSDSLEIVLDMFYCVKRFQDFAVFGIVSHINVTMSHRTLFKWIRNRLNKISRPNAHLSIDGCEVYSSQGPIYINLYLSATNTNTSPAQPRPAQATVQMIFSPQNRL